MLKTKERMIVRFDEEDPSGAPVGVCDRNGQSATLLQNEYLLEVSDQTVGLIRRRFGIAPAPKRRQQMSWTDFIRSHMAVLAGIAFFTGEVLTWRGLATCYVLFFVHLETRRYARRNHSASDGRLDGADGSRGSAPDPFRSA
ncbi:MAG: hypothetical protein JO108_27370 [Acidobacteriaceae bacterium]|nr:hypothetical protein [Acidobacteriaceae bacterium]